LLWLFFFLYYYRFYQITKSNQIEGDLYNQFTGQWERTSITSPLPHPSQIIKADNVDGLHNAAVIKGYFDNYDSTTNLCLSVVKEPTPTRKTN
jgi:hypothetical protein